MSQDKLTASTELRIQVQKMQADAILDKLFTIDAFCILAGGAPRDWHFGKAATDLDFFIHSTIQTGIIEDQLKAVGLDVGRANFGEGLPDIYKRNPHLCCVFDMKYNGTKVQIMVMHESTFVSVLPQFPLSICKAWYKNRSIHLDKDFKRSVAHKVIVKTNTVYNGEHAYIKKIVDKFPEYKYHASWEAASAEILDRETT